MTVKGKTTEFFDVAFMEDRNTPEGVWVHENASLTVYSWWGVVGQKSEETSLWGA